LLLFPELFLTGPVEGSGGVGDTMTGFGGKKN